MTTPAALPDPEVTRTLGSIEGRLRQRFPTVTAELIHAYVDDAALDCAGARVRNFLPILIERRAADALRVLPSAEGPPSTGLNATAIDIDSPVSHDQRWISPDRSVETSSTVEHASSPTPKSPR